MSLICFKIMGSGEGGWEHRWKSLGRSYLLKLGKGYMGTYYTVLSTLVFEKFCNEVSWDADAGNLHYCALKFIVHTLGSSFLCWMKETLPTLRWGHEEQGAIKWFPGFWLGDWWWQRCPSPKGHWDRAARGPGERLQRGTRHVHLWTSWVCDAGVVRWMGKASHNLPGSPITPQMQITIFFFFSSLWPYMEVPRPGIESELQLPPALWPWQCPIFNWLCRARDWTCASAATWATAFGFLAHCATAGTPKLLP